MSPHPLPFFKVFLLQVGYGVEDLSKFVGRWNLGGIGQGGFKNFDIFGGQSRIDFIQRLHILISQREDGLMFDGTGQPGILFFISPELLSGLCGRDFHPTAEFKFPIFISQGIELVLFDLITPGFQFFSLYF